MGSFSIWHILILAVIAIVLFGGRGKISSLMGDTAKGIKAFKEGLKDEEKPSSIVEPSRVESDKKDT